MQREDLRERRKCTSSETQKKKKTESKGCSGIWRRCCCLFLIGGFAAGRLPV